MTDYSARCITFTGASHKRKGVVCQDHSGFVVKQNYSLAIVADGNGSKIRSEIGSRFAIEACMDSVEEMLSGDNSFELNDGRLDELKRMISNSWLDKVYGYHIEHRLSYEEIRKAGMPSSSKDIFALYGTTLVAAVMTEKFVLVLQMGDGGCVMVFDDGSTLMPDTLDKSCDDIHNTSLSNPYSYRRMHHFLIPSDEKLPVAMAVFTYGFEVQENQDIIDSIVGIVARLGCDDHDWFTAICPEIEERTHHYNDDDDDVSLSIIFDRNIDFITLYNKTFHKEYPFYEEHPSSLDFKSRISTAATKDGWDVTENVTLVDNGGNVISGQFTNGKLTQKILPEKMLEPWGHHNLVYKNFNIEDKEQEEASPRFLHRMKTCGPVGAYGYLAGFVYDDGTEEALWVVLDQEFTERVLESYGNLGLKSFADFVIRDLGAAWYASDEKGFRMCMHRSTVDEFTGKVPWKQDIFVSKVRDLQIL